MTNLTDFEIIEALGNITQLQTLFDKNPNVSNIIINGDNIIMYCAAYGNSETFDYLIKNGSSIYFKNSRGYSPLHEACAFGKTDIIHYILCNDIKLIESTSSNGRTVLHEIFKYNQYNTLSYLISYYSKYLKQLKIKDNYGKLPEDYTINNDMKYLNEMI
jgi:ankyrin repeat protein